MRAARITPALGPAPARARAFRTRSWIRWNGAKRAVGVIPKCSGWRRDGSDGQSRARAGMLCASRGSVKGKFSSTPNGNEACGSRRSWRRERDSNPRWGISPYSLSRGAPSAARPSLPVTGSYHPTRRVSSGFRETRGGMCAAGIFANGERPRVRRRRAGTFVLTGASPLPGPAGRRRTQGGRRRPAGDGAVPGGRYFRPVRSAPSVRPPPHGRVHRPPSSPRSLPGSARCPSA